MGKKSTICVIDDETLMTDLLCEGLKAYDFEAIGINSGDKAVETCIEHDVALVLLDVTMPGMDGHQVCQALKSNPKTKHITVIFVTAKDNPADHEIGFDLGAVDYITKPFNLPMVMLRVEAALRMQHHDDPGALDMELSQNSVDTDLLTGLKNQRFLMERFQEELDKSHRYDFPVSCVILDVDTLQAKDNEKGTVKIDDLLPEIAMEIRSFTRSYDILARFDGTLFVAVLPHTDLAQATEYGTKIMRDIDATTFSDPNFPTKAAISVAITAISNGVITDANRAFGETMKTLLQAKSQPRPNRIKGYAPTAADTKSA
jgi:diguanylate cyclase (GGDEF)-like protein